jgi:hypothetical protein
MYTNVMYLTVVIVDACFHFVISTFRTMIP